MPAVDDVQINVNDLLSAMSQEAAAFIQRAVIAEQRYKACAAALDAARVEIARLSVAPEQG